MKLFPKKNKTEYDSLLVDIEKTKIALDSAYSNFESVSDPDLIDCYIYELNAMQKRYKFLLRQVKEIDKNQSDVEGLVDFP
ncbi:MAG TPA: YaaL family protein [Clostridiales bacterium]|nr:YaaL family protein [Clostridiales bacterium]